MDSRRNFLGKVASGLAGTLAAVPAKVLGANERIRVGIIGFGDRGVELLNHVRACPNAETAAISDIFTGQLEKAQKLAPDAALHLDYRRMLDDPSIDAVLIATPQHLHAEHFCSALDAGKHVYQEKTMAFTVEHAKRMRAAFRKDGGKHTVQIGHQACSFGHMHDVRQFLSDPGRVGRITAINMQMYRNTPRGKPQWSRTARITPEVNAENLRWKAFLGEAPAREFDANRYMNWRLFEDYSGGSVHENMSHQLSFWYKALNLQIPKAASMTGGVYLWKDGREPRGCEGTTSSGSSWTPRRVPSRTSTSTSPLWSHCGCLRANRCCQASLKKPTKASGCLPAMGSAKIRLPDGVVPWLGGVRRLKENNASNWPVLSM